MLMPKCINSKPASISVVALLVAETSKKTMSLWIST